jgi:hypothetical protein
MTFPPADTGLALLQKEGKVLKRMKRLLLIINIMLKIKNK